MEKAAKKQFPAVRAQAGRFVLAKSQRGHSLCIRQGPTPRSEPMPTS